MGGTRKDQPTVNSASAVRAMQQLDGIKKAGTGKRNTTYSNKSTKYSTANWLYVPHRNYRSWTSVVGPKALQI
jgi:hypothetical protein